MVLAKVHSKTFQNFGNTLSCTTLTAYFGTATIYLSEFGSGTRIYRAIGKPDPSVPRPGATTLSDAATAGDHEVERPAVLVEAEAPRTNPEPTQPVARMPVLSFNPRRQT